MSGFKGYTEREKELNKVLKYNQNISTSLMNDETATMIRAVASKNIDSSIELLKSLGYGNDVSKIQKDMKKDVRLEHQPTVQKWEDIVSEANDNISVDIAIEDILTADEINEAFGKLDMIEAEFSKKTSIINKTDVSFLAIAIALQVTKSLIFPYIAKEFGYGDSFDSSTRYKHDDDKITEAQRKANDNFRDKQAEKHGKGYWINMLYQTPPYDTTVGSQALGLEMGGRYHRFYTLGHDPVLGWIFGTANILTDIITLNDFSSYRIERKPKIRITAEKVNVHTMFKESYQMIKADKLNLPAALFAQAQHFKSDEYTKTGLPVPVLGVFNEDYALELYKNQYDALCFARDVRITGASYAVSLIIDMIIGLIHGLFRKSDEDQKLYQVRTRKILLISNAIASTSTVLNTYITENPKNLDIGSLISTVTHLLLDTRFMTKVKHEFIEGEIYQELKRELEEIDRIYDSI